MLALCTWLSFKFLFMAVRFCFSGLFYFKLQSPRKPTNDTYNYHPVFAIAQSSKVVIGDRYMGLRVWRNAWRSTVYTVIILFPLYSMLESNATAFSYTKHYSKDALVQIDTEPQTGEHRNWQLPTAHIVTRFCGFHFYPKQYWICSRRVDVRVKRQAMPLLLLRLR